MITPTTFAQRESFNEKHTTQRGLLNRAAVCDFMAAIAPNETIRTLWKLSATRRRAEAKRSDGNEK